MATAQAKARGSGGMRYANTLTLRINRYDSCDGHWLDSFRYLNSLHEGEWYGWSLKAGYL